MSTPMPGRVIRPAAACLLLACGLLAQPPLTTIQDVLYKADGTPFNGYVEIAWNSFEAADTSNIATQFRAVRIVNGNFLVKLVPTTNADPAATYTVTYHSDGKAQFQETWAVPPSTKPLRVRDVRISAPSNLDSAETGTVPESSIVGLISDLNLRPIEGPGYATGRVIVSNAAGQLEAVSGSLSDCVRVDGSAGPCGAGDVPGYTDAETPQGVVDGSNATFTLAGTPVPAASLMLYRNGMLQKAGFDFTLTDATVQFVTAATPQPGDTLLASYRVAGTSAPVFSETATATSEILCSSTGAATRASASTSLGTCVIPAGTLQPGNRVEIRFDYAHDGTQSGFSFQVQWGSTTLLARSAAGDALIAGRADVAITAAGSQWSAQAWGSVLPFAATVGVAGDSLAVPLSITLSGNLASPAGDQLRLSNFTIVRYSR